jgi:hypothetical protein
MNPALHPIISLVPVGKPTDAWERLGLTMAYHSRHRAGVATS